MAKSFRKTDSSCKTLASESNSLFYQCIKCDPDQLLYICKECKEDGDHKDKDLIVVENIDQVKFCNCGDETGKYVCENHKKNKSSKEKPLVLKKEELKKFTKILKISEKTIAEKISVLNQIRPIDMKSHEGEIIKHYFDNTNAHDYKDLEMKRCWTVYRKDNEKIFVDRGYDKTRRMLLWHGTKKGNLASILENGFRKPNKDGVKNGSMFGKGVYFADRVSKSVQYADQEGYGLLFLCEVALGSMWRTGLPKDYDKVPDEFQSIKGLGKCIPDKSGETKLYDIIVPSGKTVDNTHPKIKYSHLTYNEYIVFDPERILIKYIISFKVNTSSCSIQ